MGWDAFSKHIQIQVGVGNKVKFWNNRWSGDLPLHLAYPVLYNLATNRVASVDSLLIRQGVGGRRSWDVSFIQVPNDWEMKMVDDFLRF